MNDSLLSRTISCLRFPLIIGVVFIHSNLLVVNIQGNIVRYDQWPVAKFVMTLFSSVFADISVPLFFFISGFLFFYNTEFTKEIYINKIKKRFRTLLVPYMIWNFVAFIILLIEVHPKVIQFFPLLKDYRVDIVSFLSSFWVTNLPMSMSGPCNPINTPLWFIRDLLVIVLFSPIIWWTIRKLRIFFVISMGIIWFFTLGEYVGFPGLCHQSLFFFPLGAYFSINQLNFVEMSRKVSWVPFVYVLIAIIDVLIWNQTNSPFLHHLNILFGMVTVVIIASLLIEKRKIHIYSFLTGASFFVYALHNLFLGKMTKVVVMIAQPESPCLVLFLYFLMPMVAILICLGIYKLINRYLPNLGTVLTGGR